MKKYLSAVLILCLLFAGVTRAENKTPSANHGSVATEFGGFVVPLPDYYEYADIGLGELKTYVCVEKNGSDGAVLIISAWKNDELKQLTGVLFELYKTELLDQLAEKFDEDAKKISTQTLTIPKLSAVAADYKTDKSLFRLAMAFEETEKELLMLFCSSTPTVSYGGYYRDFNEMLEGITLKGAAPTPKMTVTNGVSPEVKAFWDEYEAFVDEYIGFMEDYAKNPYDLSLLTKLYDYIGRLTELEKKGDAYTDSKQYSGADLAYSLEVSARVLKKLSGAIGDVYGSLF